MNEINIKSSTIEKSLELAKEFLGKLVGPSVEEMGLLFGDNIKLWRLKNQTRNFEKVKKIANKRGIELKKINLKVLIPYLEGISLEENEFLQDKWANLMTNYLDSNKNLTITVYPSILTQLSTNEVKILDFLNKKNRLNIGLINDHRKTKDVEYNFAEIANLERLGLIKEVVHISKFGDGERDYEEQNSDEFYLTSFGSDFVKACDK
ncbi:Abi-alpha family protein [Algibacter sp. PT7-4]|uniref:Abi-alpha family protein n=1 Tax=Algibacter ulvanivorans TaxID=3400999 RepID=UPI003AADEF27